MNRSKARKQVQNLEQPPSGMLLSGRIYAVYFESLHERNQDGSLDPDRVTSCKVIAHSAEEAFRKLKAAFPYETVNSMFGPDRYGHGPDEGEDIILF